MPKPLLIYGVTGYTGRLILEAALARGVRPIVAGRSEASVRQIAEAHGLEWRIAAIDDAAALTRMLDGAGAVLHCAGPFSATARQMLDACLTAGAHYLDITGEYAVFELMASAHGRAASRGITLLPGTGFDVVPTDCLAAHLARRLPGATHLELAFAGGGGVSRGTALTMIEGLGEPGRARIDGTIRPVPPAWRTRRIDFDDRPRTCVTISWGDVSTAFHSTGIPNVLVYMAASPGAIRMLKASRFVAPLLRTGFVRSRLRQRAMAAPPGPTEEAMRARPSHCWGEARDAAGRVVRSRLLVPSGYLLTAMTAVRIAERVLAGATVPGFLTPSKAFGADFILEIPGTNREDVT